MSRGDEPHSLERSLSNGRTQAVVEMSRGDEPFLLRLFRRKD
ncbi:uncharacterized protein G2W53_044509 [Senna tora]|uniref:Uncharacterized protein n=1 Tax=Senna tora TaxID=362788 RepID=A0A834VYG0_9FABA|nr:uncharacterized protein G2W53_044509 [Senna tora]